MRPRRSPSSRYSLSPSQFKMVYSVADTLPEPRRGSFLLSVSTVLKLNGGAFVTDALIEKAIQRGLDENPENP